MTLHITNGESTSATLERAVGGDILSFADALIAGPCPARLEIEDWHRIRAEHLASSYGVDYSECLDRLNNQENVLASFSKYREVVLWFEHDLFCQLNLLYLLDWFSRVELGDTKLCLVNVGSFPGKPNFRGLGELDTTELASLYPGRQTVTANQLRLGRLAWEAFCSPEPTTIQKLLQSNQIKESQLQHVFRVHLNRFPASENGLGHIENRCLQILNSGGHTFGSVFVEFAASDSIYGLGDLQLWEAMTALTKGPSPLLSSANGIDQQFDLNSKFELTPVGLEVMEGRADAIALNGIDTWLGGVHLQDQYDWRWNKQVGQLQLN